MTEPWFIDFRTPNTIEELAAHLGIDISLLSFITASPSRAEFYNLHRILKRNPNTIAFRVVFECGFENLAKAHKNFLRRFERFVQQAEPRYPHACAHGYVHNRSTRTNAEKHCGAVNVLHADIKDFFPTITRDRLVALFLQLGLQPAAADLLSKFASIDDRLPLGLNASPLLANLICLEMDDKFSELAQAHKCVYTRYADDLTFSGQGSLPAQIDISSILSEEGFRLSARKFYRTKRGQSHFVTGLSISDHASPHVPRAFKRRLRQEVYYSARFGIEDHLKRAGYGNYRSGINKIDGSLKYLCGIERMLGSKLNAKWKTVLEREKKRPTYVSRPETPLRHVVLFFDESEIDSKDGKVLALGCVAVEDVDTVRQATEQLLRRYEADPFFVGRKKILAKKGLHFTDLTEEVRQDYIKVITNLPIRAFISYDLLSNYPDYKSAFTMLLYSLLEDRFVYYDRADLQLVYEQNPTVSNDAVKDVTLLTYYGLKIRSSRRPLSMPKVVTGKKREEPCLSVVDFLLGVFGDYVADPNERQQGSFERLRDQYRLIIAIPTGEFFTSKMPFKGWAGGSPKKTV
jgi:RNA-directed DNA polymerase